MSSLKLILWSIYLYFFTINTNTLCLLIAANNEVPPKPLACASLGTSSPLGESSGLPSRSHRQIEAEELLHAILMIKASNNINLLAPELINKLCSLINITVPKNLLKPI